jgi:hypothetical protein
MPDLSLCIMISSAEYDRLMATEKKYHHLMAQRSSEKSGQSASDLAGAGGPDSSSSGAIDAPSTSGRAASSFQSPVIAMAGMAGGEIPNSFPAEVNSNVEPPKPYPNTFTSDLPQNLDRIRQEAKRDKSLPSSMPLNDPMGVPDPNLPAGEAPKRQFVATAAQRSADSSTSLGSPPTKAQAFVPYWYLGGAADDDGSDEGDMLAVT